MIFLGVKALHIVAMVAWMGGLLVLGLLLGALAGNHVPRAPAVQGLMAAVHRWDRTVTTPAMAMTWLLGLTLALYGGWLKMPWLMAKLVLVVGLSALHGLLAGTLRRSIGDVGGPLAPWLRFAAAGTLMAVAVIAALVVLKPF